MVSIIWSLLISWFILRNLFQKPTWHSSMSWLWQPQGWACGHSAAWGLQWQMIPITSDDPTTRQSDSINAVTALFHSTQSPWCTWASGELQNFVILDLNAIVKLDTAHLAFSSQSNVRLLKATHYVLFSGHSTRAKIDSGSLTRSMGLMVNSVIFKKAIYI